MFHDHQPIIEAYSAQSPENLKDVLTFVLLTIKQPIDTVPAALADVRQIGAASRSLWGMKAPAYANLRANKLAIHGDVQEIRCIACPERRERSALAYFATLPGMGLVKAGFAVQLCLGLGGCIDTHNIARFGLKTGKSLPQWLRSSQYKRASPRLKNAYLDAYLNCCRNSGGTAQLWDDWCNYVARHFPERHNSGNDVSALHVSAIIPV